MKIDTTPIEPKKQTIAILSTCEDNWGGSEELWARSIPYFIQANYSVTVCKYIINFNHPEYVKLESIGVELIELKQPFVQKTYAKRLRDKLKRITRRILGKDEFPESVPAFTKKILMRQPDLVIISQAINFDGLAYAVLCRQQQIPYIIIAQKAVDFYWPAKDDRPQMADALKNAVHCFFVSEHNLVLTEEQFGLRLNNASIAQNPNKVKAIEPYADDSRIMRLACIGRLFVIDKGQDILLRVLARQKWRERNITVSFIGDGVDEDGLKDMVQLLCLKNVEFITYQDDMASVYRQCHAVVLPSRSEGLPLAIVEAMAAGRVVIASHAGGNSEIIQDGITGYLAHANESNFDEAMERAWNNRHHWQSMGLLAAECIRKKISPCPEAEFSEKILTLIKYQH
jgi:glycosyltransferase involved in cell wall biosynthesis